MSCTMARAAASGSGAPVMGLPMTRCVAPACIVVAECDALVDECIAYGDLLRAAGVAVDLEIYRGVTHDFIKMGRMLPEAAQAQQAIADALRRAFE